MSTFRIPNSAGQIRQVNQGDIFGELWETFNIDLSSSPGKIKQSDKLIRILESSDISNPSGINDLLIWNEKYFLVTNESVYSCSINQDPTDSTKWSIVSSTTNTLDPESTAIIFDGQMRISKDDDIVAYDGDTTTDIDWWSNVTSGPSLNTDYPHTLHVHRGGQETLFVTDKNVVRYYNSTAGHSYVTLQDDLVACSIDSGVSAIWVGTYSNTGGNAYVYEMYVGETIDSTAVSRNAYQVEGRAVLALWVKNNIPYIVTERGNIQAFNGSGFVTVAQFPFSYSARPLSNTGPGDIKPRSYQRPIHPRGVKTYNNSTFILINTDTEEDVFAANSRSHAGVWEFNHNTNVLNHRFGFASESTDYGYSSMDNSGALLVVDNQRTFLMAGAETGGTYPELFTTSPTTNQSWFVTPEITADTVSEAYDAIYHKVKTLADGESIYTLYRTTKRDTVYGTANWTQANQFTTTSDWSNVAIGDLVRVSHDYAAGEWAIVTNKTSSSSTTSITVNRDIGAEGESSGVYSDNFKLVGFDTETLTFDEDHNVYTDADGEMKQLGVGAVNGWIQFMVVMKGQIEYRQFISKGNAKHEV